MRLKGNASWSPAAPARSGSRSCAGCSPGEMGKPARITVFSRDEAKQHYMRLSYLHREAATDEVIYRNFKELLSFRIGDVRDFAAVADAVRDADVIIHAAALKQVPTCEYFPFEAVKTNVVGAQNLVRAVKESPTPVEVVVGISTDKACKPINVMGMTKALMERTLVEANLGFPGTRFACVRYGNVIASRGSVVPLFLDQIARGGPVTVTMKEMTRFLLSLDRAVDTVLAAIRSAQPGETYVPKVAVRPRGGCRGGAHRRPRDPDCVHRHPAGREDPRDHGRRRRSATAPSSATGTT